MFYKKISNKINASNTKTLYINDDLKLLFTAQRANLSTCYFHNKGNDYFEFNPTMEIRNVKELIKSL